MSTPKHPHESHASAQEAQEDRELDDMDTKAKPPAFGRPHADSAKDGAPKPPGRSPMHSVTVGGGFKLCFNSETESFCVLEGTREVPLACVVVSEKK